MTTPRKRTVEVPLQGWRGFRQGIEQNGGVIEVTDSSETLWRVTGWETTPNGTIRVHLIQETE